MVKEREFGSKALGTRLPQHSPRRNEVGSDSAGLRNLDRTPSQQNCSIAIARRIGHTDRAILGASIGRQISPGQYVCIG